MISFFLTPEIRPHLLVSSIFSDLVKQNKARSVESSQSMEACSNHDRTPRKDPRIIIAPLSLLHQRTRNRRSTQHSKTDYREDHANSHTGLAQIARAQAAEGCREQTLYSCSDKSVRDSPDVDSCFAGNFGEAVHADCRETGCENDEV